MKQRIYCAACGEHAFDYAGDIAISPPLSALATYPNGDPVVENTIIAGPCGHRMGGLRDMRIEALPE